MICGLLATSNHQCQSQRYKAQKLQADEPDELQKCNAGLGSAQFHSHLFLTGRKEHDYGSNESLPWPSYRRAVDLILLGHAKRHLPEWGKIIIGPRFSAARVPHHWATFIARTICLELTQTGDECLWTGKCRGCLWQNIDCNGDVWYVSDLTTLGASYTF